MSKAKAARAAEDEAPEVSGEVEFRIKTEGPPARVPCVGLPVQFSNGREVVPGVLQRRSIVNPELFDVKISLSGAAVAVTRAGVEFSETPKPGCWSYLPGWNYGSP